MKIKRRSGAGEDAWNYDLRADKSSQSLWKSYNRNQLPQEQEADARQHLHNHSSEYRVILACLLEGIECVEQNAVPRRRRNYWCWERRLFICLVNIMDSLRRYVWGEDTLGDQTMTPRTRHCDLSVIKRSKKAKTEKNTDASRFRCMSSSLNDKQESLVVVHGLSMPTETLMAQ